jgi:hypothetical protein
MKRSIQLIAALVLFAGAERALAQVTLFGQLYSGYECSIFGLDNYSLAANSPIGLRAAAGFRSFQIGLEYGTTLVSPAFDVLDPHTENVRFQDRYSETRFGVFVHANTQGRSWTSRSTVFSARGGIGTMSMTRTIELAYGDDVYAETEIPASLYGELAIGMLIPIIDVFDLSLEANVLYTRKREHDFASRTFDEEATFAIVRPGVQVGAAVRLGL